MAEPRRYTGMPRWVKASGIVFFLALLAFILSHAGGGPHQHMSADAPIEGGR